MYIMFVYAVAAEMSIHMGHIYIHDGVLYFFCFGVVFVKSLTESFLILQYETAFTSITTLRQTQRWRWQFAFINTSLRSK